MRAILVAFTVLLLSASISSAQVKEDAELIALANWTRNSSNSLIAQIPFGHKLDSALGLGSRKILFRQYCLTSKEPAYSIALNVGQANGEDVFVYQHTKGDDSILWRVARDGTVLAVARANGP